MRHNIRGVSFDKFGLRSIDMEHEITAIDKLAHKHEDRVVTFTVDRPTPAQLSELEDVWDLHPLLVEDLEAKEQRAKVERYGDVLFVVVNSIVYRDSKEDIDVGEIHVLMRGNQVAILCQNQAAAEAWHSRSAQFIERWSEQDSLLDHGPEAVIHALLDSLVDDYPGSCEVWSSTRSRLSVRCSLVTRRLLNASTACRVRSLSCSRRRHR